MKRFYCTYFDRTYLARAVALYQSMRRHGGDFVLDALCLDADTCRIVSSLGLPEVRVFPLADLEANDPGLLAARGNRSWVEYLWTLTPSIILACLQRNPAANLVTYLDADLYFFTSPEPIFSEIADSSVSLIPHRYARDAARNVHFNGVFNVGMMTFRRDIRGLAALQWWRERCLEACHGSYSEGKFGDQKYLDDWPARFSGVHVVEHIGANVGPWNVSAYLVTSSRTKLFVNDSEVIFYHFHKLDIIGENWFHCGVRWIPRRVARLVYYPYLDAIHEAYAQIQRVDPGFAAGRGRFTFGRLYKWLRYRRFHLIYRPATSRTAG